MGRGDLSKIIRTIPFIVFAFLLLNQPALKTVSLFAQESKSITATDTVDAPSNLAAKAKSSTQIALGWKDNSSDETGFKIERKTGGCGSSNAWTQIATKASNITTHTVSGLSPNTTYAFRVKAYQSSTDSAFSNCASSKTSASGTPAAPTNFKAVSTSSTKVNLSWEDNSTSETGFKIYRKAGSGSWTCIATTSANVVNYRDTTATNNNSSTTYQYYGCANNASGNSPSTYMATIPYQPTNLTAASGTASGTKQLTWTDTSSNETGFEIYRKSGACSSTSSWAKVATLSANKTSWTDTSLTSGSSYSYKIRAYKKSGAILPAYGYSLTPVNLLNAQESMPQGSSPTAIAITQDGKYAYIGFDLSEKFFKVRLEDLAIEAVADLSGYFPLECEDITLDASEEKLFVYTPTWRKLLVLNTETMSVVHIIDSFNPCRMIRSQYGSFLITWDTGNSVKFVNTETYDVTDYEYPGEFFEHIQESCTNQDLWFVFSGKGPENKEVNLGIYDYKTKTWIRKISLPPEANVGSTTDFKVLPNEQKAYVTHFDGWSPDGWGYGGLHSVDLVSGKVKVIPIEGGAFCLEASPDNRWLYVGAAWPQLDKNLLVVNTNSDSIVDQIYLGTTKFNWPYTQMNDLQIDPAHPGLLYATSTDGNALVKMNLDSLKLVNVLIFNNESFVPTYFVKRPGQATGFILTNHTPYAFEIDLEQAAIKRVVKFPNISQDAGINDIAFNNSGRILFPQRGTILEVDGENMRLLATHPLPKFMNEVWCFILSKDESNIYSIIYNHQILNNFVAINTTTFQLEASINLEGGDFNSKPFELPNGSKLYALGGLPQGNVVIHVIETNTYTIKKTITYEEPGNLGISAGPYYPFAYDSTSHTLFVGATEVVLAIDTDTDEIKKVIYLGDAAKAVGLPRNQLTTCNATGLIFNPHENYLYISHLDRSFVSIYDLTNSQFLPKLISVEGFFPKNMFANDNYSKIYSINWRSDNVSVIDVNLKVLEKVIDLHSVIPSP
jgi:hypothetical protein